MFLYYTNGLYSVVVLCCSASYFIVMGDFCMVLKPNMFNCIILRCIVLLCIVLRCGVVY